MENLDLSYTNFKSLINSKGLFWQYIESDQCYNIFSVEYGIKYQCIVHKDGYEPIGCDCSADLEDFETNYKPTANRKMGLALDPLNSPTVSAKHDGIYQVCTKNSTTNIDFVMPGNRYLSGANWHIWDSVPGDYFKFQVIDIDNILGYGANFVLSTWVDKWYVASDNWIFHQSQTSGLVYGSLYLRAEFHSTGVILDPKVFVNYHLSLKL